MMKLLIVLIIVLFSQTVFAIKYSGCTDPKYISYVEKRLSFYERLDRERYLQAQKKLTIDSFNALFKKTNYLYRNTVLSARFDTKEVALKNINAYEKKYSFIAMFLRLISGNGDSIHQINIAKGWLALKSGQEDEAVRYLLASTKNSGSPVLGSFGPDMTLIRELYKRGNKTAVLQYLKQSQSFWNTDTANEYINVWRKMIKNNCPIQFQFYDTTSTADFGLE